MESNLSNASSHRNNPIKLTHYDEIKKRARDLRKKIQVEPWWGLPKTNQLTDERF